MQSALASIRARLTMADLSLQSSVKLFDGNTIPILGLGTYLAAKEACLLSLKHSYRMLDTATWYENELGVGRALKDSNVKRSEVFVTTKLWNADHGKEKTLKAFHDSLKSLGVEYVDMYLMHSPSGGQTVETWDTILDLQKQGLIRSVGVSNFNIHHLEKLLEARPDVVPVVNQIEVHPYCTREALVQYCKSKGIIVQAYSPLTKGQKLTDPKLVTMANKYSKTPAQLLIRWSLQKGYVCIPKTVHEDRMIENADVFDFNITHQDMDEMDSWNEDLVVSWNVINDPWTP